MANLRLPRFDTFVTNGLVEEYLQALDCSRSLRIWILFKYREHDQIAELDCDPRDYQNIDDFRKSYLATSYLSKNRFLKTSFDVDKRALEKFEASELICKETNLRWKSRRLFKNDDWHAISCVANKIFQILGPSPNIEEVLDRSSWGPGATTAIKARDASSYKKFRDERGITKEASSFIPRLRLMHGLLRDRVFCFEPGDKVVVVPKNSKTGRVILIQPGWNLYLQKGVGKVIRRKLRASGLDLDNADKKNQFYARRSSIDGSLATIDFSSASDCIAIEPLYEVIPPDWFDLLDRLRSRRSADGRYWEKFSSMGNGFTFELESLVFYSLALVACELEGLETHEVSVFGDDTVLPTLAVPTFRRLCALFGFQINPSKTFVDGAFRESCGEHYFCGVDCKPVFLKEKIRTIAQLYKEYNSLRYLAHRLMNKLACDAELRGCCNYLYKIAAKYDKQLCLKVSFGYGDAGFISNFDESAPSRAGRKWQGYLTRAMLNVPVQKVVYDPHLILVRLTERSDQSRENAIEVKGRTRIVFGQLLIREWYDLGPWI